MSLVLFCPRARACARQKMHVRILVVCAPTVARGRAWGAGERAGASVRMRREEGAGGVQARLV